MPQIKRGKNLICENCKNLFYVTAGRIKQCIKNGYKIRFCSHKCYSRKGKNNNQFGKKGELSPVWRGGRRNNNGYFLIDLDGKRIYEHRMIAEKILGRKLKKYEEIHHIDFNRKNNEPENLYLCIKAKHKAFHNSKNKPILCSNLI